MKKQVVFIMTDTQRTDMVGCYGGKNMITPNLDKLAKDGIKYNKAYTCQPVCGPARSAIFTGLYPHSNGSFANSMSLSQDVQTVGQRLTQRGINAGYIGKWHLDGGDYFGKGICPDGWNAKYWYDMKNYLDQLTPEERKFSRQSSVVGKADIPQEFTYGHRCSTKAIDFLEENNQDDFFLVVSYDEPHEPCLCPKKYVDMYDNFTFEKSPNVWDDLADKPDHHKVWAGDKLNCDKDALEIDYKNGFACNTFIDYEIGRVVDKASEIAPDALIIYTSDHGTMLWSHSLCGKGPNCYEEISHIPFIVKGKNTAGKNICSDEIVSHINVTPTILDYFNIEIPKMLEGKSLLPNIVDQNVKVNDYAFLEFTRYEIDHDSFGGYQPLRCVTDGRFKLCINLLETDELYDLDNDKYELKNLILDENYKEIRNKLHDALLEEMNKTRDPFRSYKWERRPWREDAAAATWPYTGYTRQRETEIGEERQLDYDTGLAMDQATRKKRLV